jgi:guanosine-diphosphatase
MPESFSLAELRDLTSRVCHGEGAWDAFSAIPKAIEELKDRPEWCLDLNFQLALLHTGYDMPIDREVKIAKKIKGNELGWCLGARYVYHYPCCHLLGNSSASSVQFRYSTA